MLKNISNLGSVVTKTEQKTITGGRLAVKDCAKLFELCDMIYPESYNNFNSCMTNGGC